MIAYSVIILGLVVVVGGGGLALHIVRCLWEEEGLSFNTVIIFDPTQIFFIFNKFLFT